MLEQQLRAHSFGTSRLVAAGFGFGFGFGIGFGFAPCDAVAKVLNKHRFFSLTIFPQQQQGEEDEKDEAQAQLIRICKHTCQAGPPLFAPGFLPLNNILCLFVFYCATKAVKFL